MKPQHVWVAICATVFGYYAGKTAEQLWPTNSSASRWVIMAGNALMILGTLVVIVYAIYKDSQNPKER